MHELPVPPALRDKARQDKFQVMDRWLVFLTLLITLIHALLDLVEHFLNPPRG